MDNHYNNLTPAEAERLTLLSEECAEVIQAIGKIQRHGYSSCHPETRIGNRLALEKECGHVRHAMIRLCSAGDLSKEEIHAQADAKAVNVKPYLHHQDYE